MCVYVCSHGATFVLVRVGVFEAESLLGSIFLQIGELFAVDGAAALPGAHTDKAYQVNSIRLCNMLFITSMDQNNATYY